jgi:hypothetical protein
MSGRSFSAYSRSLSTSPSISHPASSASSSANARSIRRSPGERFLRCSVGIRIRFDPPAPSRVARAPMSSPPCSRCLLLFPIPRPPRSLWASAPLVVATAPSKLAASDGRHLTTPDPAPTSRAAQQSSSWLGSCAGCRRLPDGSASEKTTAAASSTPATGSAWNLHVAARLATSRRPGDSRVSNFDIAPLAIAQSPPHGGCAGCEARSVRPGFYSCLILSSIIPVFERTSVPASSRPLFPSVGSLVCLRPAAPRADPLVLPDRCHNRTLLFLRCLSSVCRPCSNEITRALFGLGGCCGDRHLCRRPAPWPARHVTA